MVNILGDFEKLMKEVEGVNPTNSTVVYLLNGYDPTIDENILEIMITKSQFDNLVYYAESEYYNPITNGVCFKLNVGVLSLYSQIDIPKEILHLQWYLERIVLEKGL
jgi:hypothetical protein